MAELVTVASDSEVLELDLDQCNGYGNCVFAAPQMFELDLASNVPSVLKDRFVDGDRADLVAAVADCPAVALRLRRRDDA
jgi:ferredoxin